MSDSISGVIIPLIIPVDAPPSLASGVQALAASLETTEFSSACLQLQQSFCYLTWHFADYSARHLQHLELEHTPCSSFGHARLEQHLGALQDNLEKLAEVSEKYPEVADVFRVFYVGGLRARHSSPRRHTRLLGLGGQSIRGYRSILEWCRLELGDEEFSGELRCQRELRRYLPILREWLDSSSGHFRQIKTFEWFEQSEGVVEPEEPPQLPSTAPATTVPTEALASLKPAPSEAVAPTTVSLTSFHTPPLLARHQALFEEQLTAQAAEAFVTLGRLAGLAVQYLFAISGAALRSIGQLDPALEKRLDTGLTLRQKQTSLTFLFKGLAQHQGENPMLEQLSRSLQAPSGGKMADFLTSTWGGGHTFAEFCMETAKPEPPPLWQERFLPGIRAWLQQSASWFAHAEHYFQTPNEQGFIGFTVQLGDEHLEIDRKALQLDTAALRIGAADLKLLLTPPRSDAAVGEPEKMVVAEAAPTETTTEPPQSPGTEAKPSKGTAAKAPAKTAAAKAEAKPTTVEAAEAKPAKAKAITAEPVELEAAEDKVPQVEAEAEATKKEPIEAAQVEAAEAKAPQVESEAQATKEEPIEVAQVEAAEAKAPLVEAEAEPMEAKPIEAVQVEAPEAKAPLVEAEAEPIEAKPIQAVKVEAAETEAPLVEAKPEAIEAERTEAAQVEAAEAEAPLVEAEPEAIEAEPTEAAQVEAAEAKAPQVEAEAQATKEEPTDLETAEAEPAGVEATVQAEATNPSPIEAEPAQIDPTKSEFLKTDLPEATAGPETAEATSIQGEQSVQASLGEFPEPQESSALGWAGPALALELWDESVASRDPEPLLRLASFLIQYTSGVIDEWRELAEKGSAPNISQALDQLLNRLETEDDTPVILPLGNPTNQGSLSHWLHQASFKTWLCLERDYRADIQHTVGLWLTALQPFFQDSEQLFEDPAANGTLEGVVVYQDRFLEFVDHPLYVGPLSDAFWTLPFPSESPTESELASPATAEVSPPPSDRPDLAALPECVTEYYATLWSEENLGREALAAGLEFFIQYFAGLLACVAIHAEEVEASHLSAWRGDSNLLQRLEMISQVLDAIGESEHGTLVSLREIFQGPLFGEVWKREHSELVSLTYSLRREHEEELGRARAIMASWIEASKALLATLENLAEPIDSKGHLEVVVQQDDHFFELVEPEYAIHLVPPGFTNWQDLICYRNLAARYGSQELLGESGGSQELSGSAVVADESDDFFSSSGPSYQDQMMEALFKEPESAVTAKLEAPKAKPQLVQEEVEPVAPPVRSEMQLNAVLEQLLQKPGAAEEEAPPAPSGESSAPATEKLEAPQSAPARVAAPTEKPPEFIVVDPPILQYTIHYDGKEGQIHTGRIDLVNTGGSLLKGTVKSNHPCLRVNPSVFRSNEAAISYWIDDSDRPSNMQKIGLSFHFSGQKVEVPMEKMLPDKKFKQLATKMLGFVKNLRQKS